MRFHQVMGWIAGFLLAPWAFMFVLALLTFFLVVYVQPSLSYPAVLKHALALGLPLFLILWVKRWVNTLTCICGGVLVAVASGLLSAPVLAEKYGYLPVVIYLGLSGAAAGGIFYLCLYIANALAPTDTEASRKQQRHGVIFGVVAILTTGILVGMPNSAWEWILTRSFGDSTCHNVLRDRDSISPQATMKLALPNEEAPKLIQAMQEFAAAHELQIRDDDPQDARPNLSLCNDRVTIKVSLSSIEIFELQPESGWQQIFKILTDKIESLWPGRLR